MARQLIMLAAAAALALAGCGDSSGSSESSATSTPAAPGGSSSSGGGGATLSVKESEFKIDPEDATVKAGKVTIEIDNTGSAPHALSIEEAAGDGKDVESGTVSPGSSKSLTADLKPGTYEWYCPIGNHKAQGMEGKLTVE